MTSPIAPAFQPKSGMRFVTLLTLVTLAHVLVIVLILAHFGWLTGVGVETDDHAGQSGIVIPVTLETAGDEEKQIEEKSEPEAEPAPESVPESVPESKQEPISEPTQAPEHTQEPAPISPDTSTSAEPADDTSTQNNTDVEKEIPLTVEAEPTPAVRSPMRAPEASSTASPVAPPPKMTPSTPTPATSDAPSSPSSNASKSASSSSSKNTSSEAAQINMASDSLPITPAQVDPNYLHRPDPIYPALSKRFRETGTVLLRVSLDATGAVRDVAVQTSSEYQRLDQAALEAVRQWRFIPASRGPQPIPSTVLVPIEFKHQ